MESINTRFQKDRKKLHRRFKEYVTYGRNYVVVTKRLAREVFLQSEEKNNRASASDTSNEDDNEKNVVFESLLNESFQHFAKS